MERFEFFAETHTPQITVMSLAQEMTKLMKMAFSHGATREEVALASVRIESATLKTRLVIQVAVADPRAPVDITV